MVEDASEFTLTFVPSEGWVKEPSHPIKREDSEPNAEEDVFGLFHAYHDVLPRECINADKDWQNGYEAQAAFIAEGLSKLLAEHDLRPDEPPPQEGFELNITGPDGEHVMPVHVVNVVNTGYWEMNRYGTNISPVLLPHRFIWRRLPHMGLQVNHVRT